MANATSGTTDASLPSRWGIAVAGVIMQIGLGAVYAWSVFRIPLTKAFGWTISQVTLTFTIAILVLGFASFIGGLWMRKSGPRVVAVAGGIFYGLGVSLAYFSSQGLWWLYLSYGLLGGIGLGLGYIVPVATLVKWFPDKRGMITGIAVAGFGAGSSDYRTRGYPADCECGSTENLCCAGNCLSYCGHGRGAFYEGSAGWIQSAGLVSERSAKEAAFDEGLHIERRARNLAMVRTLGAAIFECYGRHRNHFASRAHGSGNHRCHSRRGRRDGRNHFDCKRRRTVSMGMVFRFDWKALGILFDVFDSGDHLLGIAGHH